MSVWSKGLLAGAISGCAGGVLNTFAAIGIAPESFNLKPGIGFKHTLILMAIGAVLTGIIGVAAYLQKSPLPNLSGK